MAQNRSSQRGVVRVAATAILAALGVLLSLTGCSSDATSSDGENLGETRQALTCGLTTCAADTDCIVHSCNGLTCVAKPLQDGTACGDRFAPGQCNAGVCCTGCRNPLKGGGFQCVKGAAIAACGQDGKVCVNCDRGNSCESYSCTAGACDPPVVLPDKTACPNGACWKDACCTGCLDANDVCQPGTDVANCGSSANGLVACGSCFDTDPCTTDACTNKACSNGPAPDNTACPDGDKCNGDETCQSGKCIGPANFSCEDNNACTAESCDGQTGCAHTKLDQTPCADANKCNGDEICVTGTCTAGTPLDCNDNNPCTADSCSAASGCLHTKLNGTACGDGNKCNGAEMCVTGACSAGTPLNCDDGNPCTADSCDPAGGCQHTAVTAGTKCDDGNVCNGISTCMGTVCSAGTALNCNDANDCTDDSCDPVTGCSFKNNTADCSDNNVCTTSDKCSNGACKGGAAPNCDDNETCTTDSCDPSKGCVHAAVPDGGTCDDGNVCSTGDKCVAGKCFASGGTPCDDSNPCTQNACDPAANNACVFPNETNGTPCTSDKCHQNNTCQAGTCNAGDLVDCDDANPCTTDSCDPTTGCKHVADNAATCSDGDLCTNADHCKSGVCVGTDVACAPLDECHEPGTCNAQSGICDDPRSADNKPCQGGHCQTGKCILDSVGAGGAGGDGGAGGQPAAGGEPAAGGDGTAVVQGGQPSVVGSAGAGNEPTTGGEPTEPVGTSGTSGKSSGGTSSVEGGAPEVPEHVFVRDPGGCDCSVPANHSPTGLAWLAALALAAVAAGRRRAKKSMLVG